MLVLSRRRDGLNVQKLYDFHLVTGPLSQPPNKVTPCLYMKKNLSIRRAPESTITVDSAEKVILVSRLVLQRAWVQLFNTS